MENILPWGRQRRLIAGLVASALAVGTAVLLIVAEAGAWWFIIVFVLVWLGALLLLEARDRT